MAVGTTRLGAGLALLVLIWVIVYWWYEPEGPRVTFAAGPEAATAEAAPEEPALAPVAEEPAPTTLEPAVEEPRFVLYTIRKGDTAASISTKFFGTTAHAGAIARANPLMDIDRLREGRTIRVPVDPSNIQGRLVEVERPAPQAPAPTASPEPEKPAPAKDREYTVEAGDSLARIARRVYGSERYVNLIFEANRDRLTSPDRLKVGQVLRLPTRPDDGER